MTEKQFSEGQTYFDENHLNFWFRGAPEAFEDKAICLMHCVEIDQGSRIRDQGQDFVTRGRDFVIRGGFRDQGSGFRDQGTHFVTRGPIVILPSS